MNLRIAPRTPPSSARALALGVLLALGVASCGDDAGGEDIPPPLPDPSSIAFEATDACATGYPKPSDLFFDAAGRAGLDACPLPSDPLDAAVETVVRDQRAALDTDITLTINGTLDSASVSSTVADPVFDGRGTGDDLPSLVLFELTGTSTSVEAWRSIGVAASAAGGTITLRPSRALLPGRLHVVIATRALRDSGSPQQNLVASPAVAALVGSAPIGAGAFAGLDDAGAQRLERMRLALQDALAALAAASPPIAAADIVSIHSFTTRLGMDLIPNTVARYEAAVSRGTYRYQVKVDERDIPPGSLPIEIPMGAFPNVLSFIRGSVVVPRMLNDDVRLRANWDTAAETVDVPFLMSIPRQGTTYPVAVHVAGYGRSSLDASRLANAIGGGPRGSVLSIELRCHGRRSPGIDGVCVDNRTDAEAEALIDQEPNNDFPLTQRADGIPDASGVGYFPGDPRRLRDSQLAAIIEVMHVLASLRDATAWTTENIPVDRTSVHVLAQGYTALPAAAAAAFIEDQKRVRTLQFLSGGADLAELIVDGGMDQRAAFNEELPGGIGEAQARTLLARVSDYLAPVQLTAYSSRLTGMGGAVRGRFLNQTGAIRGLLLAHASPGQQGTTQYVNDTSRNALVGALTLPSTLVSQHRSRCDNYFLYTCQLGEASVIFEQAQAQIAGFITSNGVTFPPPG